MYRRGKHSVGLFRKRLLALEHRSQIVLPETFIFDENKSQNRGNPDHSGQYYSFGYELDWEYIPEVIKNHIENYDSIIKLYLGSDYRINIGRVWRNLNVPIDLHKIELFSQLFHYDKVVDYRNLQLFVLMSDTTVVDGPLEYSRKLNSQKIDPDVFQRAGKVDESSLCIKKFTGSRGDTILLSTGATPHRAGIPAQGRHRDMFSVAFFPAYTKIGLNSSILLNKS